MCSGDVKQIHAHFHVSQPSERMTKKDFGGSVWFDIGIYTLNLVDFLFNEDPIVVKSTKSLNSEGVDKDVIVNMEFSGQRHVCLTSSMTCQRPCTAVICGTKGSIEIKEFFHAPTTFELRLNSKPSEPELHDFPLDLSKKELFWFPNSQGFQYQIEHVRECLQNNLSESPVATFEATERLAKLTEVILQ